MKIFNYFQKYPLQVLKPRNILVEWDETSGRRKFRPGDLKLKLTDFGLSGDFKGSEKRGGSPIYGAPEVFGGKRDHMIDEFSLARVCLFLALDQESMFETNILKFKSSTYSKPILSNIKNRLLLFSCFLCRLNGQLVCF